MLKIEDYALSSWARETLRCLFLKGPTWDGNIPSKAGRGELIKQGLADRAWGYAWLTRAGIDFAVNVMDLDKTR
jgi:hypothetical protein